MTSAAVFLLVLTVLAIIFQGINHWFLAKGKLSVSYPMTIMAYMCCTVLEVSLAVRDPDQWSIILFVPLYLWAILMAAKGMWRLYKEKKDGNIRNLEVQNVRDPD